VTRDEELADRLVQLTVVVLGIKAAGLLLLAGSTVFRPVPARALTVSLVLGAAMIVACFGLVRKRRWGWALTLTVLIGDAVIIGGLLRLLIDVGLALVLFQPAVRHRFGMRCRGWVPLPDGRCAGFATAMLEAGAVVGVVRGPMQPPGTVAQGLFGPHALAWHGGRGVVRAPCRYRARWVGPARGCRQAMAWCLRWVGVAVKRPSGPRVSCQPSSWTTR
jgi:hypothetical protein